MDIVEEDEAQERYQFILDTIQELESGVDFNQGWYDLHSQRMLEYQKYFPTFGDTNPEVCNQDFRDALVSLDLYIEGMISEYNNYRWFDSNKYLQFNKTILWTVEFLTNRNEEDELSDMLVAMCLSRETNKASANTETGTGAGRSSY
jgi:hypothetical protein